MYVGVPNKIFIIFSESISTFVNFMSPGMSSYGSNLKNWTSKENMEFSILHMNVIKGALPSNFGVKKLILRILLGVDIQLHAT